MFGSEKELATSGMNYPQLFLMRVLMAVGAALIVCACASGPDRSQSTPATVASTAAPTAAAAPPAPTAPSSAAPATTYPAPRPAPTAALKPMVTLPLTSTLPFVDTTKPTSPFPVPGTPVDTYSVVNTYPHDPGAFTEGLVYENGFLYEGTGNYGASSLRKVTLETGAIVQQINLANDYFGEGVTIYGDAIVQLTWQTHLGF